MSDFKTLYRRYATGRTSGSLTKLVTGLLLLPSLIYRLIVWIRNRLYNARLLPVANCGIPVISVGNIAAGGTGKTPIVDYLVRQLVSKGRRVGIVSRGYGGSFVGPSTLVSDGQVRFLNADLAGDEPVLLARRNPAVPVAISPKRIDGVRLLIESCQVDCVVLDDAFQHRAVARDLDIVLLDGRRPVGNGYLLPAGILREPFSSIRRADLAILTRCDPDSSDQTALPIPTLKCRHDLATEANRLDGGTLEFKDMAGKKIFAFAGIADPEVFFSSLRDAGVTLSGSFAFSDHVIYSSSRLATLVSAAGNADLMLTTEKDAVKLDPSRLPLPCYSVGVQTVFEDDAPLLQMIDKLFFKEKDRD